MKKSVENLKLPPDRFTEALSKIVKAGAAVSRHAVEESKSTKPSLHKRFVYFPQRAAIVG
jgi:hypothetical protein